MGAGVELGRHHGVHFDHDLLLLGHDGVALLHLRLDPGLEGLADDSRADVHNPLLGHLRHVGLVRQVIGDVGLLAGELADLLERQVLVLRHVQGLDFGVVDVRLLPRQDVLQEVDGHIL